MVLPRGVPFKEAIYRTLQTLNRALRKNFQPLKELLIQKDSLTGSCKCSYWGSFKADLGVLKLRNFHPFIIGNTDNKSSFAFRRLALNPTP